MMANVDPWEIKVLTLVESEIEFGPEYVSQNDLAESLRPLDRGITSRRVGSILARLGFKDKRRFSDGVRVYVDAATIAEAKKRLNGGEI